MVTIILFGDLNDKKITNLLINKLEGRYNIVYFAKHKLISYKVKNSNETIIIIETDSLKFIDSYNTIFLFKNLISKEININIKNDIQVIVFSQNIMAVDFLRNNHIKNIITFGYRSTDTLTSSSFNNDKKTICLQRQIHTIDGRIIEPFEFSIDDENEILNLLPIYGIKILLGDY